MILDFLVLVIRKIVFEDYRFVRSYREEFILLFFVVVLLSSFVLSTVFYGFFVYKKNKKFRDSW